MLQSLNRKYPFNNNLKINLRSLSFISLGLFLFLLFFHPFEIHSHDFDNRLIILATFGAITLLLLSILRLVLPSLFPQSFSDDNWNVKKEVLLNLLFIVLNSVAHSFFARYVGGVPINFPTVINIVIMSIVIIVVLITVNKNYHLKKQVIKLSHGSSPVKKAEPEKIKETMVNFESENKTEFFQLPVSQVILIKSASNYIEVFYLEDGKQRKKLIRNTLKNAEEQLSDIPELIRCHRSCIVNRRHVIKWTQGKNGFVLALFNYSSPIHVSRQYALLVKDALRNLSAYDIHSA